MQKNAIDKKINLFKLFSLPITMLVWFLARVTLDKLTVALGEICWHAISK